MLDSEPLPNHIDDYSNTTFLKDWRKRIDITIRGACELTGYGYNSWIVYERTSTCPRVLHLACLALEAGLIDYDKTKYYDHRFSGRRRS